MLVVHHRGELAHYMTEDFTQLYQNFKDLVYNLALQYVQNVEDAEEITQDVFLKVHQKLHDFKSQSNVKTWIYRITVNTSLDHIKKKRRKKRWGLKVELNTDEWVTNFDHPGVILENKEATATIFFHINQLPNQQKTALILTKIEGLSQAEAAEIMKISTKAVESIIQRAKKNLNKKLP